MHPLPKAAKAILAALFTTTLAIAPAHAADKPAPADVSAPAPTANQADAAQFIQTLGNRVLSTLSKNGTDTDQIKSEFRTMVNDNFDLPGIGRFVIGRYWNMATPAQQQEYMSLFEKTVEQIYAERFSQYSGETFTITGNRKQANGNQVVTTQINRPSGPPVVVDWRVRARDDGKYQILDVLIEGVSMSITQRDDFAAIIQRNGGKVEGLLAELHKRTNS